MKLPPLAELFATPTILALAFAATALVAFLSVLEARRRARRRDALLSPALAARTGLPRPPGPFGPATLLGLVAALAIGLALARPRWGDITENVERKGADVVVVLDTSASMRATDVTPSRFVLARQAAASLLARLGGDRIALVGCEGDAQVLVPLTLDTAAVGLFLDALEPGIGTRPGTSIAAGLATAVELLPAGPAGGKQCVFISDGEDLEGGVDEAVAKAKAEGIVIHTVFVGAPGRGAPVPEVDVAGRPAGYKTGDGGAPVLSRPDPELLRSLAARTGGSYSVVSPGRTDLDGVAKEIDRSARRPLAEALATRREERFQFPLAIAVLAAGLLLAGPLPRRARRVAPLALLAALLLGTASAPAQPLAPATLPTPPAAISVTAPPPDAPPAPAPPQSFLERILSGPPFTTARSEAVAGRKDLLEKRLPEAVAHFGREAELAPKDPTGPYNLGTALSRAGKAEEALKALELARREGGRELSADAAYNAGTTLYRAQQYEPAASAFREALKRRPGDPDASYNYELSLRRAEEEKQKQEQQKKQQQDRKDNKDQKDQKQQQTPPPSKDEEKRKADQEFEKKANMSREKAEQLLSAISRSDLEEQKKKIAEQKKARRPGRDW